MPSRKHDARSRIINEMKHTLEKVQFFVELSCKWWALLSSTCCILFTFCFFSKQLVCWERGTYNQCYGHKQKLSWRFIGDNPDSKNKVVFLEWKKRVFIHAMRYFWWEPVPLCVFWMQRMMERNLCCGTQTKQGKRSHI